MRFLAFIVIFLAANTGYSQLKDTSFHLYSAYVADTFIIKIAAFTGITEKGNYYSIYTLDGDETFAGATLALKSIKGLNKNILLISVCYGAAYGQKGNKRDRDYSPTLPEGSHGSKFLNFLSKELIPYISVHYPVREEKTLTGYSAGANFTLYTLLTRPLLFTNYLAGSIGSSLDSSFLFRSIKKIRTLPKKTASRLFISAGSKESWALQKQEELLSAIKKKKLKTLDICSKRFEGLAHGYAGAFTFLVEGLRWLLAEPVQKK